MRKRIDAVGLAEPLTGTAVRGALLFVMVGMYTLGLRPFNVTITNIHIMPTRLGNQSLGRFLTYPTVFVPLGYWVLAGGRRRRWWRLGVATTAFLLLNIVMLTTGFQRFRPPYTWYLDALGQAAILWAACVGDDLLTRADIRKPSHPL